MGEIKAGHQLEVESRARRASRRQERHGEEALVPGSGGDELIMPQERQQLERHDSAGGES
jgi:hypothetical protein